MHDRVEMLRDLFRHVLVLLHTSFASHGGEHFIQGRSRFMGLASLPKIQRARRLTQITDYRRSFDERTQENFRRNQVSLSN